MGVVEGGHLYDVAFKKGGVHTSSMIWFDTYGEFIHDLNRNLPIIPAGTTITVAGSDSNDGDFTVVDSEVTWIQVAENLTPEGEGAEISITIAAHGHGFMIVPTSAEFRRRANDFAPVIGVPGAQLEYAEDIWRPWTMGDFRGGLGQEEWDDPTRFDIMTAGLRIYKNRITLDTQFHDEDAGVVVSKGVDFAGDHYAISVNTVRKRTTAILTASNIAFAATTPGTITHAGNDLAKFVTGDKIIITGSANNDGTYDVSTGGVAGTLRTTQETFLEAVGASVTITGSWNLSKDFGVEVRGLCVWGQKLWASTWGSRLWYTSDGAAWTQDGDAEEYLTAILGYREFLWIGTVASIIFSDAPPGNWKPAIAVGDVTYGTGIINMAVLGGFIAIGRTDGIYIYEGSGDRAEGPIIDFENMDWSGNCKLFTVVDGFLYYNIGDRVKKADLRGAEFDITPSISGDKYKELYGFGVPVGGQGRQGHLYVAFAGTKHVGGTYPAVLEITTIDVGGWRVAYEAPSDLITRGCWFSDVADRLFINDGTTRSQRFQPQSDAPYPDYVQTASIITSWFDAGDVWSQKIFRKMLALARDLSATETIKPYYEKDYSGAWVLIETLTSGGQNEFFFDPNNVANSARKWRLKIELSRDPEDSGVTPTLLLPLVVSYIVRPDPVYAQQVVVRLQEGIQTHQATGGRKTLSAGDITTLKAFLRVCEAYPLPVEYTDRYGATWDVFISRTEELRSFRYPVGLGGEERQEDVMIVTMREV